MGAVAIAVLWVGYSVGMWGWTLLRGYCVTPADIVNPGFPSRAAHWAGSEVPPKTQALTTPAPPAAPAGPSAGRPGSPAGVGAGNLPGTPVTGPGGVTLV